VSDILAKIPGAACAVNDALARQPIPGVQLQSTIEVMRLGRDLYQQPGEHVEHARVAFLRVASELDERPLQDVYREIYPAFLGGSDTKGLIPAWCRRWNFMFEDEAAEWVIQRVNLTLPWWKRGKPNPEQFFDAELGGQPLEPLEWFTGVFSRGAPTILKDDEKSPFEHAATYSLSRLQGESDRQYFGRVSMLHRRQRTALKVSARKALAITKRMLSRTPSRSSFEEHLEWAARFQIFSFEVSAISEEAHADVRTVGKGINEVLRMIGLTRRKSDRIGRPPK
jgi:hypothetical protein